MELRMCEHCDLVVPVNIFTPLKYALFSYVALHTTVHLDRYGH